VAFERALVVEERPLNLRNRVYTVEKPGVLLVDRFARRLRSTGEVGVRRDSHGSPGATYLSNRCSRWLAKLSRQS
jgi:hypothetical protein